MAKQKSRRIGLTIEEIEQGGVAEETCYEKVKKLIATYDDKKPVGIEELMETVRGFCGEYENQFPKESIGYPDGSPRKMHLIRGVTTFKFIAPYKIKDQDRVDWGWETIRDLSNRLEEMTGGNVSFEIDVPFKYRVLPPR